MKKIDEILLPDSCLNTAENDELLFVVLARDKAAPRTLRTWIRTRVSMGLNKIEDAQIQEAINLASLMAAVSDPEGHGPDWQPIADKSQWQHHHPITNMERKVVDHMLGKGLQHQMSRHDMALSIWTIASYLMEEYTEVAT